MNGTTRHICAVLLSLFLFATPALADHTEQCLQLYYTKAYAKALPFCTLSAEKGNSQSQYVLGLMYSEGLGGVKKNKPEAIKWLRAASGQAHAAAHYKLVKLENEPDLPVQSMDYYISKQHGAGAPIRPSGQDQEATSSDQHSAALFPPAPTTADSTMVHGDRSTAFKKQPEIQLPQNRDKPAIQTASTPPAIAHTIKAVRQSTLPDDKVLYRQHLIAAKQGDANARLMLGLFYLEGRGVQQDSARATSQVKLAAKQGQAQAQFCLGLMYYEGRGSMIENKKMAEHWLTKAATQGLADAQYSLGQIYANNEKNESEAIKWWRKAAAQKHAKAQHNLAIAYLTGKGVRENRDKATAWFIKEAEQGDPQAQFNLARLYSEGEWLSKSGQDAATWFYQAGASWLIMKQPGKARQSAEKIRQLANEQHLTAPNLFLADVLDRKITEIDAQ